jgi:hypothetical protein
MIGNMEWLKDSIVHSYARWKNPKSLALVWMCSRTSLIKLKALKWKLFKYGKIEVIQAQEVDMVFLFILDYMNVVLSRGMQL